MSLKAAIHGLIAAGLASMAMSVEMGRQTDGYSEADRKQMAELIASVADTQPVVLTKNGFVIYDSGRAETIAKLFGITPENENAHERWGFK